MTPRAPMTVSLFAGETGHTICRQNCHRDPARPVRVEWSAWFVIKVSALAFVLAVDAWLMMAM